MEAKMQFGRWRLEDEFRKIMKIAARGILGQGEVVLLN